jgi:hypothetical protein
MGLNTRIPFFKLTILSSLAFSNTALLSLCLINLQYVWLQAQ